MIFEKNHVSAYARLCEAAVDSVTWARLDTGVTLVMAVKGPHSLIAVDSWC